MQFTTLEIRGSKYEVDVDKTGVFSTEIDGARVDATTLELLRKKLIDQSKRKQKNIRIPFAFWEQEWNEDDGKILRGVCIGMHAGNDNLLVIMDGEKKSSQMSGYGYSSPRYVKPEHAAELEKLSLAVDAARKARDKFLAAHKLDLRAKVREALGEDEGGAS